MGNGRAFKLDFEHRLAGVLGGFFDGGRDFIGFAVTNAHVAATITGYD